MSLDNYNDKPLCPTITCMYVIILKYISTQLNSQLSPYCASAEESNRYQHETRAGSTQGRVTSMLSSPGMVKSELIMVWLDRAWNGRINHGIAIHPKSWGSWGSNPANVFWIFRQIFGWEPKTFYVFSVFRDSTANFLQIMFKHCLNLR